MFGVAVLACRLAITLSGLVWLMVSGDRCRIEGHVVVRHGRKGIVPFSWCRWIFIPADGRYADSIVVAHEAAHLARNHWVDLLVAELVLIIDWYNPAAWQMRDSLQDIHEFQADADVLAGGVDARTYQMFLIKKTVGDRFHSLADSLNHSSLKKRITMMLSRKTRSSARLRAMALVPALALGAFVINLPAVASVTEALGSTELAEQEPEALPTTAMEPIAVKDTDKSADVEVFNQAEQMPQFPGGEIALMQFIVANIKMPEGGDDAPGGRMTAVVRFVIDKTGKVSAPQIIKSAGNEACDAEALRVVGMIADFTPGKVDGKPVAVYYALPITFAWTGSDAKATRNN